MSKPSPRRAGDDEKEQSDATNNNNNNEKKKPPVVVLFLCTGNSCRSQMAEGWAKTLLSPDDVTPLSAGIETHGMNPRAVLVMKEVGVDISSHRSKKVEEVFGSPPIDFVVTVCAHANETCPRFPATAGESSPIVIHHGFDDPPKLAAGAKTEEEALDCYRRVRDEIRDFVSQLPGSFSEWGKSKIAK